MSTKPNGTHTITCWAIRFPSGYLVRSVEYPHIPGVYMEKKKAMNSTCLYEGSKAVRMVMQITWETDDAVTPCAQKPRKKPAKRKGMK